jgi:hypothetical protein
VTAARWRSGPEIMIWSLVESRNATSDEARITMPTIHA